MVLVSATPRTVGAGGRDLGVDLGFGERRCQGCQLAHGAKELIDPALFHGIAQQTLHGLWARSPADCACWANSSGNETVMLVMTDFSFPNSLRAVPPPSIANDITHHE